MSQRTLTGLLLATLVGASATARAQVATAADPHAGHAMPAPAAVDHSQHAMPAPAAVDHSQHVMPAPAAQTAGLRDPHAYAHGHSVGSGPYALPGGHAAHMSSHAYQGAFLLDRLETAETDAGRSTQFAIDAWYGQDFRRWWLLSEGEHTRGDPCKPAPNCWAHAP